MFPKITALVAPLPLILVALSAVLYPGRRPLLLLRLAEGASLLSLALAIAAMGALIACGPTTVAASPWSEKLISARLDVVSCTMLLLVAFIGWIVVRYSQNYLDGEARQGAFTGWLCLTIAAVLFLVVAGNLVQLLAAWIVVSYSVHNLLLFYPERPGAQRAARKKLIFSSVGTCALFAAALLLFNAFGTTDIAIINAKARNSDISVSAIVGAALIAFAALLKSAQFPTHGWLTEVMEAPTPVSALMHAGVINAGGFLLIRFAELMIAAPSVLAVLVMIGGFTALFGALVMLTQPAVKTSLAWSTVSQMGFMILQCGLALFPLALLHIVAHSLYKAHSFLASGSAVERIAEINRPGPVAIPNGLAVAQAFLAALAIYAAIATVFGLVFGFQSKSSQSLALGAILILGIAYLLAQGLADTAPKQLTARTAIYSMIAAISYFTLQTVAEWLTGGTLPSPPTPGRLEWTLIALSILSFGLAAIAQSLFPLWSSHPAAVGLRVHLSNGLYINAILDRLLGGWRTTTKSTS